MPTPPVVVGKQIAISVGLGTVTIEVICNDDYMANVLYEDIVERLKAGEGVILSVEQEAEG